MSFNGQPWWSIILYTEWLLRALDFSSLAAYTEPGFFGGLEVGASLSKVFQLLAEFDLVNTRVDGSVLFNVAGQWFIHQGFYLKPRIGLSAKGAEDVPNVGFLMGLSGGYEIMLSPHFALSPELEVDYLRFADNGYLTVFGGIVGLRWYF